MENDSQLVQVAKYASFEAGAVDALLSAMVGVLRTMRNIPEIPEAVIQSMAEAYPREGPRSENESLVQGFEHARDHILQALRRG
jgi:hypothetical protein